MSLYLLHSNYKYYHVLPCLLLHVNYAAIPINQGAASITNEITQEHFDSDS